MSSPRNNKQHAAESQTGSVKRIDNGRQHVQQDPAASESCFNSLSDAEEHFEFSPDITDDPQGGEELGLNDSKLSSDSFRSTSSASSVSNNNNNNNNPFPRNNHLRQSFTGRTTSWSPRSGFNRRSLTSNNNCNNNQLKCISANGHARQMFASSGTSPSSRRSSFSDEAISSNDPASLEDDVLDLTQKVSHSLTLLSSHPSPASILSIPFLLTFDFFLSHSFFSVPLSFHSATPDSYNADHDSLK